RNANLFIHLSPLTDGGMAAIVVGGGLIRLNASGAVDQNFHAQLPSLVSILTVVETSGGKLVVGGGYNIGAYPQPYLTQLLPNGALDESFGIVKFGGAYGSIQAMARTDDSKIIVG